ncbi:MAG: hypothetical protein AMXMBFR58_18900 [Phycisphaerae bacterium]
MTWYHWVVVGVAGPVAASTLVRVATLLPAWIRLRRLGLEVTLTDVFGMHLRRSLKGVVRAVADARAAQLPINLPQIELIVMAGGDASSCLHAARVLRQKRLGADLLEIIAAQLGGIDVVKAAHDGVASSDLLVPPYADMYRGTSPSAAKHAAGSMPRWIGEQP